MVLQKHSSFSFNTVNRSTKVALCFSDSAFFSTPVSSDVSKNGRPQESACDCQIFGVLSKGVLFRFLPITKTNFDKRLITL